MFDLIFNKDDSFFSERKKLASTLGRAPQENDAKLKFAIHPHQGIRQFHDNC